ncbi:MAG TPA: hypothetical protein VFK20_02470 [Vicinamibacterales bacterium]|nr:hypothetical protein [Vicinamibacterales bacterium]
MSDPAATPRSHTLEKVLCLIVFTVMIAAVLYAASIALSNYSRIGV